MPNQELKTTVMFTYKRGERVLIERDDTTDKKKWIIQGMYFNEQELAALAYFAIQELSGILCSVFADHAQAATQTQIERVQDSLSWIAEALGPTPGPQNDQMDKEQRARVKEIFDRIDKK